MVDACMQGLEGQKDIGEETERFPRFGYGRHVIRVQKLLFNDGYKGKYFILQASTVESTDPGKNPVGETRVWMIKMNATNPEAVKIRRRELSEFLGALCGFAFPQDKARFDAEFLPRITGTLEHALADAQPYTGTTLRMTVSWGSDKKSGDPLQSGFDTVKFYPMSVPVEACMLVSPPVGYKPYAKPGTAPAYAPPAYAPTAAAPPPYAPPTAAWQPPVATPPPPAPAYAPAAAWQPPPGAYVPPAATQPIIPPAGAAPDFAAYQAWRKSQGLAT